MQRKSAVLLATTNATGFAFAAAAQERVVNVYNWSDYIDSSIVDDFTKGNRHQVIYDV